MPYRPPSPQRALALGAGVTVVSLLPVFLAGSLVVQMTADLGFGAVGLGALVALNRTFGAALAPWAGPMTDRLGGIRSLRVAAVVAMVCSMGIAFATTNWITLAIWMTLAGAANVFGQTAANWLLSQYVPVKRLGLAFGMKQSAPPLASMLGGLSVPLIGVTIGWRWAFVFGAVMALITIIAAGPAPATKAKATGPRVKGEPIRNRGPLLVLVIALGFANIASAAVNTFYVDAAVRDGNTSPEMAGTIFAIAGAAAIATRLIMGVVSDRYASGHLVMSAVMLLAGAVGVLMLAQGGAVMMGAGAIIATVGTWGFPGVYWFALVKAYPDSPGRLSGYLIAGALIGATLGPMLFGVLATATSYPFAWRAGAIMAVVGAVMMIGARNGLRPPAPA